jgi:hypothetical protein|tara:strand:+ start:59 stop:178 length:120 start_codon:yes stop_codon:yes gene_type:complete
MAEINYTERPTDNKLHQQFWDKLSQEKPIILLSKDYSNM